MIINPEEFINHTGGAPGADMAWDEIGRRNGVHNHIHYKPKDVSNILLGVQHSNMLKAVADAANALARPTNFKGVEMIHRDYLQAYFGDEMFAISYIMDPGDVDFRGNINKSGKQVVMGGTGWTVEMAIQMEKRIYVFDMKTNKWYEWDFVLEQFLPTNIPTLTLDFAGIGSRILTPPGIEAIEDVYKMTFKNS